MSLDVTLDPQLCPCCRSRGPTSWHSLASIGLFVWLLRCFCPLALLFTSFAFHCYHFVTVACTDFLKGRGEKKGTLACVLAPKRALSQQLGYEGGRLPLVHITVLSYTGTVYPCFLIYYYYYYYYYNIHAPQDQLWIISSDTSFLCSAYQS